jgi:hypothetical protein
MDNLSILHSLESFLGFDLTIKQCDSVLEYLDDDPMCADANYLAELFALERNSQNEFYTHKERN